MNAWIAVPNGQLPTGFVQYVLVWNTHLGIAQIAWRDSGDWFKADGDDDERISNSYISHWAPILGPNGEDQVFPLEDELDEVQS